MSDRRRSHANTSSSRPERDEPKRKGQQPQKKTTGVTTRRPRELRTDSETSPRNHSGDGGRAPPSNNTRASLPYAASLLPTMDASELVKSRCARVDDDLKNWAKAYYGLAHDSQSRSMYEAKVSNVTRKVCGYSALDFVEAVRGFLDLRQGLPETGIGAFMSMLSEKLTDGDFVRDLWSERSFRDLVADKDHAQTILDLFEIVFTDGKLNVH
ncbi:MAG: hypothetical protein Q9169_006344 [Polycauliona sp. 2 TL-2023]